MIYFEVILDVSQSEKGFLKDILRRGTDGFCPMFFLCKHYYFCIWDECMNYNLKWGVGGLSQINCKYNGCLGAYPQSKCKFILIHPSLQIPFNWISLTMPIRNMSPKSYQIVLFTLDTEIHQKA